MTASSLARAARLVDDGINGGGGPATVIQRHDAAVASNAPLPLPPELPPVSRLKLNALPAAFEPWVTDVAERMNCPPDFVAIPLLVAASSLVGRRVAVRPLRKDDWTERANLWALTVGRPGLMKSPAMSQALAPIHRLEQLAAEKFNGSLADHAREAAKHKFRKDALEAAARQALKKDPKADIAAFLDGGDAPPALSRERFVVNDTTYEKLGEILQANADGVLVVRDEMKGFFSYLGKEENGSARAFYIQAWSGGRYTFDRIGRGTLTIPDARLSIVGAIQPGPLAEMVRDNRRGGSDDGMIERFLIAWPDSLAEWKAVDREPSDTAKHIVWTTFNRINSLTASTLGAEQTVDGFGSPAGLPFVRFDPDAQVMFGEWRVELERGLNRSENAGLESAMAKFRHHIPALAVTTHVVDGGTGPIGENSMAKALALAEYFESHARRLHASSRHSEVRAARLILAKIDARALGNVFSARDIYRHDWAGLTDKTAVNDALTLLVDRGWLVDSQIHREAGGRPTTIYSRPEGVAGG